MTNLLLVTRLKKFVKAFGFFVSNIMFFFAKMFLVLFVCSIVILFYFCKYVLIVVTFVMFDCYLCCFALFGKMF